MTQEEIDLAWSQEIGESVVDELAIGKVITDADSECLASSKAADRVTHPRITIRAKRRCYPGASQK
jgi:hypothetical protein